MPEDTLYITPEQLCIGLYIHLDLGWMSHPFPLSSFRIASPDQIETIRGLGLNQLRWSMLGALAAACA